MDGWSVHFNAPMDLIDITTIVLRSHFKLKFDETPVDNNIE